MTFLFGNFCVLDSFAFMRLSLDTLTNNLNPYYYTKLIEKAGKKQINLSLTEIEQFKRYQKKQEIDNITHVRDTFYSTSHYF